MSFSMQANWNDVRTGAALRQNGQSSNEFDSWNRMFIRWGPMRVFDDEVIEEFVELLELEVGHPLKLNEDEKRQWFYDALNAVAVLVDVERNKKTPFT